LKQDSGEDFYPSQQLQKSLLKTRGDDSQGVLSLYTGLSDVIIKTKEWIVRATALEKSYHQN